MCVLHFLGIASDTYGLLFLVPDWPTCDFPRRLGDNNTIELKKKSILPKQMQIGCQWQKRAHSRNSLCSFSIKKKFYPKKQNDNTNDKFSGNERATGTRIISFFFFVVLRLVWKLWFHTEHWCRSSNRLVNLYAIPSRFGSSETSKSS